MGKIYRIDIGRNTFEALDPPRAYRHLGGRGLSAAILRDEVDPKAEPLSAGNKLVVAPGLLGGSAAPCSGRLSFGAKSPLTGTIKESNAGGLGAQKLARLGVKALVFEGQPNPNRAVIRIDGEGVEILSGEGLHGLPNYECVRRLRERFGKGCATITVGPAGERGFLNSTIAVSDMDGLPTRQAARGGLGALLASKGVKAIVIDDSRTRVVQPLNPGVFREACRAFAKYLIETKQMLRTHGTAVVVNPVCGVGGLPTRNFSRGRFEKAAEICGEKLHDVILERGGEGKIAHVCCPGCVVACSNVFPDRSGKRIVSSLEYETIALLGANLEIASLDDIAGMNLLCNDYGIDTIETGVTLGLAMEAGLIPFGDARGARRMIEEIGKGSILGRVLGNGAATAGRVLGVTRVPAVKGQAMPAYDPRGLKGTGTTYAMSPMGADHTAGNCLPGRGGLDCTRPEGQVGLSVAVQTIVAALDTLGLCIMVGS
ncbi:MAG: aldehyde ferredoxin oxidoreductase, partial [Deltaproteobacteria bacterium]|nr:aldehyde ferredoxin oxidoreductase [Deltaproteobacteria bacterium]